jgi:hypothetical protein
MDKEKLDLLEQNLRIAHRFQNQRAVLRLCDEAADAIKALRAQQEPAAPKRRGRPPKMQQGFI